MSIFTQAQTLVIKVGSSLVTGEGKGIDRQALLNWAMQIASLRKAGKNIVMVSSGAIAEGLKRLGYTSRPKALNELQAAAAVGQMGLAQAYEQAFSNFDIRTAQILLTHDDLADRTRYLNAHSTLLTLLHLGVIPIINENDTVATTEIKLGDNDTLAALVTNLIAADALLILTDQSGLFDSDPRSNPNAKLIQNAQAGDVNLEKMAGGAGSSIGTGGMMTKVLAAKRAAVSGAATIIASGKEPNVLQRLAMGESIGTTLHPSQSRLSARKQWLLSHIQVSGSLVIDQGACTALTKKGSSLLPIGCLKAVGKFKRGELVSIQDTEEREVARGLVNYHSDEVQKICQFSSKQIESKLGYLAEEELVHRDNLILR